MLTLVQTSIRLEDGPASFPLIADDTTHVVSCLRMGSWLFTSVSILEVLVTKMASALGIVSARTTSNFRRLELQTPFCQRDATLFTPGLLLQNLIYAFRVWKSDKPIPPWRSDVLDLSFSARIPTQSPRVSIVSCFLFKISI